MQEKPTKPFYLCSRCAADSSSGHHLPAFRYEKSRPEGRQLVQNDAWFKRGTFR